MSQLKGYEQLRARLQAIKPNPTTMRLIGTAVVGEAKLRVPRKTATLARSIRVTDATATNVTVTAEASYAAYVELGTKAHDIVPRTKKALAFYSQGIVNERFGPQKSIFRLSGSIRSGAQKRFGNAAMIVVKRVHHPGTKAKPYLVPGAKAAVDNIGPDIIMGRWNGAA